MYIDHHYHLSGSLIIPQVQLLCGLSSRNFVNGSWVDHFFYQLKSFAEIETNNSQIVQQIIDRAILWVHQNFLANSHSHMVGISANICVSENFFKLAFHKILLEYSQLNIFSTDQISFHLSRLYPS